MTANEPKRSDEGVSIDDETIDRVFAVVMKKSAEAIDIDPLYHGIYFNTLWSAWQVAEKLDYSEVTVDPEEIDELRESLPIDPEDDLPFNSGDTNE